MAYPNLTISSIKERCAVDLNEFHQIYQRGIQDGAIIMSTNKYTLEEPTSVTGMTTKINQILELMNEAGLEEPNTYIDKIGMFEEKDVQYALWVYRTYLFYQLLIFVSIILINKNLYNEVIQFNSRVNVGQYPYNDNFTSELLPKFYMAIFGSLTPTSDIDVGVQYTGLYGDGSDKLNIPLLSYIVSTFENLFLIFTNHKSLDYDIETYADMLTIKNPIIDSSEDSRLFYLDSSHFKDVQFNQMLEIAGNSIARNAMLADPYFNLSFTDLLNILSQHRDIFESGSFFQDLSSAGIINLLESDDWFENSKRNVRTFLNLNYDKQREEYYKKVERAEQERLNILNNVNTIEGLNISSEDSCKIMWLSGDALTYRMESYTCTPTVVHVVRILQATSKTNPTENKYQTYIPDQWCSNQGIIQKLEEPFCSIGKYGFILSMLEQIGYIYRFIITYCSDNEHYDEFNCSKKVVLKYLPRYKNGLLYFKQFQKLNETDEQLEGLRGGNKRKNNKRTKRKNNKKTKRKNNKRTKRKNNKKTKRKNNKRTKRKNNKRTKRKNNKR
jgi:hypothetical protein